MDVEKHGMFVAGDHRHIGYIELFCVYAGD